MDTDKIKRNFEDVQARGKDHPSRPRHGASGDDVEIRKLTAFSKELDIPVLNLFNYQIAPETLKFLPEEIVRTYRVMPVAKFGEILTLAISDPFDIMTIDSIRAISKSEIQLVLSTPVEITQAIETLYGEFDLEKMVAERAAGQSAQIPKLKGATELGAQEKIDVTEIAQLSQSSQIVDMVNAIMAEALYRRASDIHIEPYPGVLRVRYRIDGVLQEKEALVDKKYEAAILARIKIMSKLDITQRRLPQDGRISLLVNGRDIDLRVSILPLASGEKVVLRILEKGGAGADLQMLGFSPYAFEAFQKASARPHGMILLTGPTGSGKSTTLYALLSRLNDIARNLITIEDPVEYQMKGITQVQVKSEIGLTFASILRAVLRQNPDAVMVGEIRDFETADIAIKAALTGHLILSTLHTNDAPSAIVRLVNMGIESFLIASTLNLIAAQRLCRKICPKCKDSQEVSVANFSGMPADFKETKARFWRGKGCPYCANTGYFGRVAIVEALFIDDDIRQMMLRKASILEIREYARGKGMRTLREDAIEKCLGGEISLDEVLRVTPDV